MSLLLNLLESCRTWGAPAPAPGYCRACSNMLGTAEGIRGLCSAEGHPHLNQLECLQSAERGCGLCKMIYDFGWKPFRSVDTKDTGWWKKSPRLHFFAESDERDREKSTLPWEVKRIARSIDGTTMLVGKTLRRHYNTDIYYFDSVVYFVMLASEGDPAAALLPRRPVTEILMADAIMDGVAGWIRDCITGNGHNGCVYNGKPRLPTRVLDVESLPEYMIRLHPTGPDEIEDYAALSYCWGGPQPLTASDSNLEELIHGIEVSALPLTLQDAVLVTRRLGFRYLWIDALCIIQDNYRDKLNEIGKMGKIYRNATITIVASYSGAASRGFLTPSLDLNNTKSCTLPFHVPGSEQNGTVTICTEANGKRPIQPLSTRGWAYQEAVLSPRLVTFSESEIYCECHRHNPMVFNSGNRRHIPSGRLYAPDLRLLADVQEARRDHGDGWMDVTYLAEIWENAIVQFTLRALTVPDDRLPGVQGLANEVAEHLGNGVGGIYLAGTWTGCLPRLLLWSRSDVPPMDLQLWDADGNFDPKLAAQQRTRSQRAPSWSWASLDCPIRFFSDEGDRYDAMVSVVTDPTLYLNSVALSPLAGSDVGKLDMLELECGVLERTSQQVTEDKASGRVRIAMDLELEDDTVHEDINTHYLFLSKNYGPDGWDVDIKPKGPLYLWYSSGLVVSEIAEGLFTRVGYFRWDYDGDSAVEDEHGPLVRRTVRLI